MLNVSEKYYRVSYFSLKHNINIIQSFVQCAFLLCAFVTDEILLKRKHRCYMDLVGNLALCNASFVNILSCFFTIYFVILLYAEYVYYFYELKINHRVKKDCVHLSVSDADDSSLFEKITVVRWQSRRKRFSPIIKTHSRKLHFKSLVSIIVKSL